VVRRSSSATSEPGILQERLLYQKTPSYSPRRSGGLRLKGIAGEWKAFRNGKERYSYYTGIHVPTKSYTYVDQNVLKLQETFE